jgi:hypothetical protein
MVRVAEAATRFGWCAATLDRDGTMAVPGVRMAAMRTLLDIIRLIGCSAW